MSFVSLRGVSKSYQNVKVINNLNLDINKGDFVSIVGPYGCGKTTLLRLISTLLPLDSGQITINRKPAKSLREKSKIGLCFQTPTLFPWLNTIENIMLPQQIVSNKDYQRALDLLEMVNLAGKSNMPIQHLSGGTMKLVCILQSLILDPELLLLDEPFSSIDEPNREFLQDKLLTTHDQGKMTTILVTHSLTEAIYLSNKVVILSRRPTQVKTILDINFSTRNTQTRFSPKFIKYLKLLRRELTDA